MREMSLACKEYVATSGCDDRESSVRLQMEIAAALSALRAEDRIEGFLVRAIHTIDDIQDEDLDEATILDGPGATLPVVWLNVTFRSERFDPATLVDLEQRFGLRLIASFTS